MTGRDGCKILTRLAKRQCCKCWRVVSSGAKNISHADRVFYHKIQRDFQKHQNKAHNRKRVKGVAGRAKHEKLARVVEFCVMVCHHGLWYFTGHFVGQWNAAEFSAKSFFPVPRLFHDKKNSLRDGWHPKLFPGTQVQPDKQQIGLPLYKRICTEFEVEPATDFRFTPGQNHGLTFILFAMMEVLGRSRSGTILQPRCQTL